MITIDKLKEFGANTEEGLHRCLDNEAFYLRLVGMAVNDEGFEKLKNAIDAGDLDEAFERAHALKGSIGNVSLTPLLKPIEEMTEELRARNQIDYAPLLGKMTEELEKLKALLD